MGNGLSGIYLYFWKKGPYETQPRGRFEKTHAGPAIWRMLWHQVGETKGFYDTRETRNQRKRQNQGFTLGPCKKICIVTRESSPSAGVPVTCTWMRARMLSFAHRNSRISRNAAELSHEFCYQQDTLRNVKPRANSEFLRCHSIFSFKEGCSHWPPQSSTMRSSTGRCFFFNFCAEIAPKDVLFITPTYSSSLSLGVPPPRPTQCMRDT